MRVIVIGAGILGSAIAWNLARAGAEVTVIEAGQGPAGAATGASFGWINASFHLDADHYRLRIAGIEAWHDLAARIDFGPALRWPGALWWEAGGNDLHEAEDRLRELGYGVTRLGRAEISAREPALADPPEEALFFAGEGVAEPAAATRAILAEAAGMGARVLFGLRVQSIREGTVITPLGRFEADRIVVAAGTGSVGLLHGAEMPLPLLPRPALVLRTAPVPQLLTHILVTPEGEIRQDGEGRIVMPTTIGHQSDEATQIGDRPDLVAHAATERLRRVIRTEDPLDWADVTLAMRPYPRDGRPVIGPCTQRIYAAVMHSGITLAAITGELAAAEILDEPTNRSEMLAPYRPGRF